jgi:hypothetical protein
MYNSLTELVNRWSTLQNDGSFESHARESLLVPLAALRGLIVTNDDAAALLPAEVDLSILDVPEDEERAPVGGGSNSFEEEEAGISTEEDTGYLGNQFSD